MVSDKREFKPRIHYLALREKKKKNPDNDDERRKKASVPEIAVRHVHVA